MTRPNRGTAPKNRARGMPRYGFSISSCRRMRRPHATGIRQPLAHWGASTAICLAKKGLSRHHEPGMVLAQKATEVPMSPKHSSPRIMALVVIVAVALFAAPRVWAQERHVVDRAAMQTAVAAKVSSEASDRKAVLEAVHQPEAKQIAERLGLDLTRVDDAVAALSPSEVKELAGPARTAAAARTEAGGDAIVISI